MCHSRLVCFSFLSTYSLLRYDWWDLASAWGAGGEANRDKVPSGLQPKVTKSLHTVMIEDQFISVGSGTDGRA
jgi:hypothetical protein